MIIVYVVCGSKEEAKKIGKALLKKRLCGCVNIFANMTSLCFWPPKTNKFCEVKETVLLVKTMEEKFAEIETETRKLHSYDTPCIFSIRVDKIGKSYLKWLKQEIS